MFTLVTERRPCGPHGMGIGRIDISRLRRQLVGWGTSVKLLLLVNICLDPRRLVKHILSLRIPVKEARILVFWVSRRLRNLISWVNVETHLFPIVRGVIVLLPTREHNGHRQQLLVREILLGGKIQPRYRNLMLGTLYQRCREGELLSRYLPVKVHLKVETTVY